jgi:hypothetical protein
MNRTRVELMSVAQGVGRSRKREGGSDWIEQLSVYSSAQEEVSYEGKWLHTQ